jgi:hypothetical protein
MNYRNIFGTMSASLAMILLSTGCTTKDAKPEKVSINPVIEPYSNSGTHKNSELQSIKKIIYDKKNVTKAEHDVISKSTIIGAYEEDEYEILPTELRHKKVNNFNINAMKLGSALKLILSQTKDIGFIPEPNVDLNIPVTMTIKDLTVFETLKTIAYYSGYAIKYNAEKKAIIISPYIEREYHIPASIFTERNVDINLGGDTEVTSSSKPKFDMSNNNIFEEFEDGLKNIGTAQKQLKIDKQSGIVYLKEKPFYIEEIDNYVTDFVQERMTQYSVELAIVEYVITDENRFNVDIGDIVTANGMYISSLTGGSIGANSIASAISSGGVVLTGAMGAYNGPADSPSNYLNLDGTTKPQMTGEPISMKYMLDIMQQNGNAKVVQKPNTVIQNHSIGYISTANETSYVASYKQNMITTPSGSTITYEPVIKKYRDGVSLPVRLDEYKNGLIQVSLAMSVSDTKLQPYTMPDGSTAQTEEKRIKEGFSVVNIHDGDIIILGGMKSQKETENNSEPLASRIPFIGELFKNENSTMQEYETAFIIKVKKINNAKDTHGNQSYRLKNMYKNY